MDYLQRLIHALEVGGGMRYFRIAATALAILLLAVAYNWRAFRNFNTVEAMDAAQLARNISEGKGYTTDCIRPFSYHLLKSHAAAGTPDPGRIKNNAHPDLANPPVYPVLLAGAMFSGLFNYVIPTEPKPFWTFGNFYGYRCQPDFLISALNQVLFFVSLGFVFLIARKLFDVTIAWIASAVYLGSELFWRFAVSGQSTTLLILVILGLVYTLVLLEEDGREPRHGPAWPFIVAALAGLLLALAGLTRYSFLWLIVPVVAFVVLSCGNKRWALGAVVLSVFILCVAPWIVRNISLCGAPFGTATFSLIEETGNFAEFRLQRSLNPDVKLPPMMTLWSKMMTNLRPIVASELPSLGGSWLTAFFLVGLLIGFRNPGARKIRYFILGSLGLFAVVQALGLTHLTKLSPTINSENLVVVFAPLVIIYGVSLFAVLFEQLDLPFRELKYVVMGAFLLVASFPLVLTFLPPKVHPPAWPPYTAPGLQTVSNWLKPEELAMSDLPWAVAWYGNRQTVWLTLQARADFTQREIQENFFVINDYEKPISLLYLSPEMMNAPFMETYVQGGESSWGGFILGSLVRREVPDYFPLRKSQPQWISSGQLVLTDSESRFLQD